MGKNFEKNQADNSINSLLLFGFLFLILLQFFGGIWHSYYSWGFSYWSVLPNALTVVSGLLSIIVVLIVYKYRYKLKINILIQSKIRTKLKSIVIGVIVTICLGFILYLFRSKAHIYGDGFSIIELYSADKSLELINQHKLQFLTLYLYQLTIQLLSKFSHYENETVIAVLNILGGIFGLWGIYKNSCILSRNRIEKLFFIITALSNASIILFFGYIENYTWAMAFMLWSIYYCIRYIKKTSSIFPPLICTSFALAFHMIMFPVFVLFIFVLLYRVETVKMYLERIKKIHFTLFFSIGSLIIVLSAQLLEISAFVPLWSISDNNYSLLSFNHMTDVLNLILLVAPLGLIFYLLTFKKYKDKDLVENILFLITLLTILSACVIDPQLGMIRDFDLLSFFGIPMTLWGGYRLTRLYTDYTFPVWIVFTSLIISVIHIVPNLYEKNNLDIAIAHVDKIINVDPHYQEGYQDAFRGISWGIILEQQTNQTELAKKYYERYAKYGKDDATPFYNLGAMYYNKNNPDSARYYLQKGIVINPNDADLLSLLAQVEFQAENVELAEKYALKSVQIDSTHIEGLTALAVISYALNKKDLALSYCRRAYNQNPNDYNNIMNMASFFKREKNIDSTYFYYDKALSLADESQKISILEQLLTLSLYMNNRERSIDLYYQLKKIAPQSQIVLELQKRGIEK